MKKDGVYKVQTWDKGGALTNSYEVVLADPREVGALKAFLKKSAAHVVISKVQP